MLVAASVTRVRSSCRLAGRIGTKTLYLTQTDTAKSGGVKSDDRSDKAIFPTLPTGTRLHDDLRSF